jgi:uncharacterized membrane protein YoaT (DUF817 family)
MSKLAVSLIGLVRLPDLAVPETRTEAKGFRRFVILLLHFGWQEALACVFPVFIFTMLLLSHAVSVVGLPRYDFLLIACLAMQVAMVTTKLETIDELKVICLFHLFGLALEIFKVHMGSWAYPEDAYTKVYNVPLYSGFMYASVASYICQAWRRMGLAITDWPTSWFILPLGAAIYLNFFTHHFIWDIRWLLIVAIALGFWRTRVHFTVERERFQMPLGLSFLLIGFFIWLAENIATFLGAWQYPHQGGGWRVVHTAKISSWFLLVIVSIIIVTQLKRLKLAAGAKDFGELHLGLGRSLWRGSRACSL